VEKVETNVWSSWGLLFTLKNLSGYQEADGSGTLEEGRKTDWTKGRSTYEHSPTQAWNKG